MGAFVAHFGVNEELLKLAQRDGLVARELRNALAAAGRWWFRKLLPLHFKAGAALRYRGAYTRRSRAYEQAKGHRRPMVGHLTGRYRQRNGRHMRDQILQGRPTITAKWSGKSTRVQIKLPHARLTNIWSGYKRPNFHKELTAVRADEIEQMRVMVEEHLRKKLQDALDRGPVKRRRIAG